MEQLLFSNVHLKKLMVAEKINEAKEYISKFFYSSFGEIFFFDGHKFVMKKIPDAKALIANDCKIEIKQANEQTQKFEKITYNASSFLNEAAFMDKNYKPDINYKIEELTFTKTNRIRGVEYTENFINMAKEMRFSVLDLKEFNEKITKNEIKKNELRESLKMVYNHIFEVLCSSDTVCYEYVLNWLACTFNGRKLMTLLYLQSSERTGKGIIINDLINKLFDKCMHKTNSVEEIVKYNKSFEGCKLINLDEVPMATDFKNINDAIKYYTTEPTFPCRDIYCAPYLQKNTFNIIMTSNNNCLLFTQNAFERNVCLEISECKKGVQFIDYFVKLAKIIGDDDVKMLFQQDMNERYATLGDWNENDKPMTLTKKIKIIEGLPKFYKYIKDQFILKKIDLNLETKTFFTEYSLISKDTTSTNQLGKYLRAIGVEGKKQSNNNGYKYIKTWRELLSIFREKLWIDDLVDLIDDADDVIQVHEKRNLEIMQLLETNNDVDDEKEPEIIIEEVKPVIIEEPPKIIIEEVKPIIIEEPPKFTSQKELTKHYDKLDKEDKKKKKVIKKPKNSDINHYENIANCF